MKQSRYGMLLCLVSPAGGGKTTLRKRLLAEFDDVQPSISVTTRAPRAGEVAGVNYHFVSEADFQTKITNGEFFEWEEVHGNCYGTLRTSIDVGIQSGIDLVFDIDIRGANSLRKTYPRETVVVFIVPPSPQELRRRLTSRGGIDVAELRRRLGTAEAEYALLQRAYDEGRKEIDYLLVNDDLETAYARLRTILGAERIKLQRYLAEEVSRYAQVPSC